MARVRSRSYVFGTALLVQLLAIHAFATSTLAQNLLWAKRAGGAGSEFCWGIVTGSERCTAVSVDGSGNIYVTGSFQDIATFGAGEPNQTQLTATGTFSAFVAKYNSDGALAWAKRAEGHTQSMGIAIDGSGNSYVTGFYQGTALFGPGDPNETPLSSSLTGGDSLFVAKYTSDGSLAWAKHASSTANNFRGLGIGIDGSGNSYVTGWFQGTATFGPGEPNEMPLLPADGNSMFVAKYNSDGTLAWVRNFPQGQHVGWAIAVDGSGSSYVTGWSGLSTVSVFVAKWHSNGSLAWAKEAQGTGTAFPEGRGIVVDASGNSYVTGMFTGTVTFGSAEPSETPLTSAGDEDIFVAKYNSDGTLAWAKSVGNTNDDQGNAISLDSSGNPHVTGSFTDTVTFGSGEPNQTSLTSALAGFRDAFVAKYNSDGTLAWAKRAGGMLDDLGFGIAVDGLGNSYVTGIFAGTAIFGSGEPNQTSLTSAGMHDIFIAKFGGGDRDGDGIPDALDNCVNDPNPLQENADGDLLGDACDPNSFAPAANNDSYSTNQNTPLTVLQPGVLGNDTDADPNTTLTAQVVSNPSHAASFTLNSNGSFSYTPVTNYSGPDSFTYRANDGEKNSNVATVTITVNSIDTIPPDTTITSAPPALTNSTSASFNFTSNEPGSTFECKLDAATFTACTSPQNYTALAAGTHSFQVRAIDPATNIDPTPAIYNWTVNTETTDTTPPALGTFVVNTPTVDAGSGPALVQVTLVAADNLSGVGSVFVDLRSPSGNTRGSICARTSGTSLNGTYQCTSNLPQYSESGVWQFSVRLSDVVGNSTTITNAQLIARGFSATFTNTGQQDIAPPVLTNFVVNTPTVDTTNGPANVQTTVTITDDVSGVATPFVDLRSPSGQTRGGVCSMTGGTPLNATYQCTSSLPQSSESGVWQFSVRLSDVVGNSITVTNSQLIALGFPATFTNTGQQDTVPPSLTSFVVNTPIVDTSNAAANVQTTLTITDNLSGVATPFVDLNSPSGQTRGGVCSMTGGTSLNAIYQCTSNLPQFSEQGVWQFSVRLSDLAGNNFTVTNAQLVGLGFPATFVNSPAPDTTITANPAALTNSTTATFSFTSTTVGSTFACSLDGSGFTACTSPTTYNGLATGSHNFQVRATAGAGNTDPTPATYTWTIDMAAPNTIIASTPPAVSNSTNASFDIISTDPGSTFDCSLDGGSFSPCGSVTNFSGLAAGSHTLDVRGVDPAGNSDPTPATHTWTINITQPTPTDAWSIGSAMTDTRREHSSTLLSDGRVLITGGQAGDVQSSAEIYDPILNHWNSAAPMSRARFRHTTNLLADGRAIVIGGSDNSAILTNAEIYNPASNNWIAASSMSSARYNHTATLLADGRVLVVGGAGVSSILSSAEIFDPRTNSWSPAASMSTSRSEQSATLLGNGRVLVVGGIGRDTAEIYDPIANSWSPAASMSTARGSHTATLLTDGRVLVAGGSPDGSNVLSSTQVYDPATNSWSAPVSMGTARSGHTATLVSDGRVVVAGGFNASGSDLATTDIYNPATNNWSAGASLNTGRYLATATRIMNNRVLLVGGYSNSQNYLAGTEIWNLDGEAPNTTITAAPSAVTNSTTATFSFTSTEPNSTFECMLDSGPFAACTSPQSYTNLSEGNHSFQVRGKDAANNVDQTPASFSWMIDIVPPETTITSNPPNPSNSTSASFSFTSTEANSSFECKLDNGAFTSCTSPQNYTGLANGSHTFQVRAIDPAGNQDTTPASYTWTITTADITPPETTITGSPAAVTTAPAQALRSRRMRLGARSSAGWIPRRLRLARVRGTSLA